MTPLERCLTVAKESGVPKDQAKSFISKGYIPLKWQWKFHAKAREADLDGGPVDIGAGGARGPGKSHAVMSQVGLDDCQRVDNLKVLFLRQTSLSATESFSDLIEKTLRGKVNFTFSRNSLRFPNGSRVLLGGFKDEKDIDKYVGIEYDVIVVEELNQLTKTKYEKLRGSLRTSKPNWRPRTYTSFNPGGVGHDLVKNRYVVPHLDHKETDTAFVPSTYKDNVHLNKEYIDYLEGLEGELGRAWREGEFFIFAGQMFTELREKIHICQPKELPSETKYFAGYDYGYNHPFAFVLLALTPDGDYYVVSHLRMRFCKPEEQGKKMIELLKGKDSTIIYAGHDIYANRDGGRTIEDQLLEAGFIQSHHAIMKASIDHIQGVAELRKMFSLRPDGTPYLQFFSNTLEVYECLATRQIDPNNPEDVLKQDAVDGEGGDDLYDALRYAVRSWTTPNKKYIAVRTDRGQKLLDKLKAQKQAVKGWR